MNLRTFSIALGLVVTAILATALPVEAACTISTTPVSFGSYDVFATTPVDSTGSVTYRCQPQDKNITVSLNKGGSPTFDPRRMLKGSEALNYNLFLDPARVQIWGDGTAGTQVHSDKNPPNNQDVTVTVFGRIPAGQDVSAGTYTDTITATVTF